jgi:hypothetical protein
MPKKEIEKHFISKTIKVRYCDFEIEAHKKKDKHFRFLLKHAIISIELDS